MRACEREGEGHLSLSKSGGAMSAAGPAGVSVQKRISDQRQRLLALDYHDPFTAESLALVERLFEDLITTTESYEDLQQRVRDGSLAVTSQNPSACMGLWLSCCSCRSLSICVYTTLLLQQHSQWRCKGTAIRRLHACPHTASPRDV